MSMSTGDKSRKGRIRIENVEKVYDPEGVNVHAVTKCSADIQAGEIAMVVGPSGCGKTTLLNAIAGFDNATGGAIYLDDQKISGPDVNIAPGPDRMVVFQGGALFPWKTVIENITYGPVMQERLTRDDAVSQARTLMANVGLRTDIEDLYPEKLSSGMRRQVEIIRALINDPKVLLLDEPFRALDNIAKSLMHEYLLEIYEMTHKTIFFITHDLEEAVFLADRIYVMTTRPGTFRAVIDVDIPRPRSFRVLATQKFAEIKDKVAEEVEEETMKAFEAGERELA